MQPNTCTLCCRRRHCAFFLAGTVCFLWMLTALFIWVEIFQLNRLTFLKCLFNSMGARISAVYLLLPLFWSFRPNKVFAWEIQLVETERRSNRIFIKFSCVIHMDRILSVPSSAFIVFLLIKRVKTAFLKPKSNLIVPRSSSLNFHSLLLLLLVARLFGLGNVSSTSPQYLWN